MNRIRQRCLLVSLMVHISLGLLLIISPGFSKPEVPLPVLTLVPTFINLTDNGLVTGGTPTPHTEAPKPAPAGNPNPPSAKPVVPVPKDPPSEPPTTRKSDAPTELGHHTPVATKDAEAKPNNGRSEPQELSTHEPVQDRDSVVDPVKDSSKNGHRKIEINTELKRRSSDNDTDAKSAQDKAEADARERTRTEFNRYNQQRQLLAKNLGGVASDLAKGSSSAMEIQMPGSGGEVFADYRSYLAAFYKEKWNQHKPGGISVKTASALTSITVGKDGHLRNYKILESSGLAEIDRTIRLVFDRYNQLRPFPSSSTDDERTFTLTFRIESESLP